MMTGDRQPERRDSSSSSSSSSSSGTSSSSSSEEVKTQTATIVQQAGSTTTTIMTGVPQVTTTTITGAPQMTTSQPSSILTSRTVGASSTTYGHSLYPNSYSAADQSGMQTREETRKVSSTIISESYMNEMPEENVKYVEVPVIQEIITHVTKKEIIEVEKRVPKYEYEYIEKIVEIPQIQIVDKHVEVPQIQEVIRHVPKLQIVDRPKEVLRHVPKIETKVIEKTVEVPGPIVEVPKPYTVENPIPVTAFVDSDIPVVVAQSVHPTVTESDDVVEVDVTDYEPHVVPVDVHVVKPVSTAIHAAGHMERHRLVSVPHSQYNSLLKSLNPHLAVNGKVDNCLLPFVKDEAGQITFLKNEAQFSMLPENAVVENMPRLRHKHREGRIVGRPAASAQTLNSQYDYSMPAVPVCQPRITKSAGAITSMMPPQVESRHQSYHGVESRKTSYTGVVPQTSTYTTTSHIVPQSSTTRTTETVHRMPEPTLYTTSETTHVSTVPVGVSSSVIEASRVTSQLPYSVVQAAPMTTVTREAKDHSVFMSQQSSDLPPVYPAGEGASTYYTTGHQMVMQEQYGMPNYSEVTGVVTREAEMNYSSHHHAQQQHHSSHRSGKVAGSNAKTPSSSSLSSSDIMQVETDIKGKGCCGCGRPSKKEIYVVRQDSTKPSTHHSKSHHTNKSHKSDMISARSQCNEDAYVQGEVASRAHRSDAYKYEELSMPVTTATEHDKSKKGCCC